MHVGFAINVIQTGKIENSVYAYRELSKGPCCHIWIKSLMGMLFSNRITVQYTLLLPLADGFWIINSMLLTGQRNLPT